MNQAGNQTYRKHWIMKRASYIFIVFAILLNSCKQPNESWKNLIGSNLNNWTQQKGSASFELQDSVITGITAMDSTSKNSWLCTKDEFKDFILEYDAWIDEGINSGVQIRCNRNPLHMDGNLSGYTVVLDQSEKSWSGGIYDETGRSWLCTLERNPDGKKARKNGEWNHFRIEAYGNSIRTWVNGIPCADLIDDKTLSGFIGLNFPGIGSDSTKMGKVVKWKNLRILKDNVQKYLTPYQPVIIQNSYLTNTLSRREAAEGWKLLWDGKTTNGWRGAKLPTFPEGGWIIKDGVLSTIENGGTRSPNGGDIVTIDVFKDYEFCVDFLYTPASNSGIKYFVDTELNKNSPGSAIGCEYSILDEILHPDSKDGVNGNRNLAGVYDLIAPLPRLDNGVGNWNRAMIIVICSHVEHWLNGQKTLEYERGSNSWRALAAKSKFKVWPNFGVVKEGHILLQDHGNEVSFRNIKIKEIKPD